MLEVTIHNPTVRKLDGSDDGDKVRIEFVAPKRPLLFKATYMVYSEIKFPRGYGVAYYNDVKAELLFAYIPFNILVGFAIHLWLWLRTGFALSLHRNRKSALRKIRERD